MAGQVAQVRGPVVDIRFPNDQLPELLNAWKTYRAARPAERPGFFPAEVWPLYLVAFAFVHNRRFGLLFLLGLVAEIVLRALGVA